MSLPIFDRILVTGGTGFIGRYVVSALISAGCRPLLTVFSSDRDDLYESQVDVASLDLRDTKATCDLIDSYRPQAVIHLAGATGHDDPTGQLCHDLNYVATNEMLKHLCSTNVERVVMLGSAAEYGNQRAPFSEGMPASPVSAYGTSMANATEAAMMLHSDKNLPVTVLRVFSAFGLGQPSSMFLPQLISHALSGNAFQMSDGRQKRDYVFVGDVARAILLSLASSSSVGRVINIGSGTGLSLREVAAAVWRSCEADPLLLEIGGRDKRGDDAADTEADIRLAAELLDWSPTASLLPVDGLTYMLPELIDGMRQNLARVQTS